MPVDSLNTEKRPAQAPAWPKLPFSLAEIGRISAGKQHCVCREGEGGYCLVFAQSGRGTLRLGTGTLELPAGHGLLFPGEPYRDCRTATGHWEQWWLHLGGAGVEPFCTLLACLPVRLRDPDRFARRLTALTATARQTGIAAAARISHGISALLTDLVTSLNTARAPFFDAAHPGVDNALRYIEESYREALSLGDLARRANLSKYHFVRIFQRQVGATPHQYLIRYRVGRSKLLLCATSAPVAEIAAQVGYPSESNYIRQFGRLTGMTPARFRRENKGRVVWSEEAPAGSV